MLIYYPLALQQFLGGCGGFVTLRYWQRPRSLLLGVAVPADVVL
jgi:hypothetical protein